METSPKPSDPKKKQRNSLLRFSGLAFQMGGTIGGLTYAGVYLDNKFPKEFPVFTLIFSLSSVFIALYLVIRDVNKDQ